MNPNMRQTDTEPTRMATLAVGSHTIKMPEDDALTLFAAAAGGIRTGMPIALNPDIMVVVSQGTPVSIITSGAFVDQCNPDQQLATVLKRTGRGSTSQRETVV